MLVGSINAHVPAWLPESPLRDTSCRCRPLYLRTTNPVRGTIRSHPRDGCRILRGDRPGTGRSWPIHYSRSGSFNWSLSVLIRSEVIGRANHAAPESFSTGY